VVVVVILTVVVVLEMVVGEVAVVVEVVVTVLDVVDMVDVVVVVVELVVVGPVVVVVAGEPKTSSAPMFIGCAVNVAGVTWAVMVVRLPFSTTKTKLVPRAGV